ncbi:MAG: DUF4065 domain-containing protein [Nitrosopumilus sp.]|nr:DUF4065 domain-containing protein [Nitrosopumilus sp.]
MEPEQPYTTSLVADYIIGRGGGRLDQLQVIKLAFISYGYVLAHCNRKLFNGAIEAWQFGPVVPAIHDMLKPYGFSRIDRLQYCQTGIGGPGFEERMEYIGGRLDGDVREILDLVVDEYGRLTGDELVRLTHRKGSPWSRSYVEGAYHTVIPDDLIREYYSSI